jgi:hypothetical protein
LKAHPLALPLNTVLKRRTSMGAVNFLLVLGVPLRSTAWKMHLHGRSKFSARGRCTSMGAVNFLLVLGVALRSTAWKMHLHGRSKFSARAASDASR